MTRRHRLSLLTPVLLLAACLMVGCEGGFVREAARTSFASFVIDILSTAVNETIAPD